MPGLGHTAGSELRHLRAGLCRTLGASDGREVQGVKGLEAA